MDNELREALANRELPLIASCDEHPDAGVHVVEEPDDVVDTVNCDECGACVDAI